MYNPPWLPGGLRPQPLPPAAPHPAPPCARPEGRSPGPLGQARTPGAAPRGGGGASRPRPVANPRPVLPLQSLYHDGISAPPSLGRDLSLQTQKRKRKINQAGHGCQHRQFSCTCPVSKPRAQPGPRPREAGRWGHGRQGRGRGPAWRCAGSSLLGCPSRLYINSLNHLCIENKSVCFVRKVWTWRRALKASREASVAVWGPLVRPVGSGPS